MADEILFGRRCRVTLVLLRSGSFSETDPSANALVIEGADNPDQPGLRVRFQVTKSLERNANPAIVTISNLSPTHRAAVQKKGVRLVLESGYQSTGLTTIFVGDVRTADSALDVATWHTTIKCGDAERSIQFARASTSFAAGVTLGEVVTFCARATGLALGNTLTQAARLTQPFYQGYTVHGPASGELDRLLRAVGWRWSSQDGQIQILAPGESVENSVPEVSIETGLIGSPEAGSPETKGKPQLIKFTRLLLPQARAGGRVHLRSDRYNGVVKLKKLEHIGDVRGGEWFTSMEGIIDPNARLAT